MGLNPVMLLVKLPIPVPSLVLLSVIKGSIEVLQQTPLEVTLELPSEVISPPLMADIWFIDVMSVVVNIGTCKSSFLQLVKSKIV